MSTGKKAGPGGSATPKSERDPFVTHNVLRHLALYRRCRIGTLVWKSYRELRQHGQPIPEGLLAKLDEWAAALTMATDDSGVAAAIEMETKGRQPAAKRLRQFERNRDLVEDYRIRTQELGVKPMVARRATAERFCLSPSNVARIVSEWHSGGKDETPGGAGIDLQRAWLGRNRD